MIDNEELFLGFKRIPITIPYCGDVDKEVFRTMFLLGFSKIEYNCCYEGNVSNLIEVMKTLGWIKLPHPDNNFLLQHPDSVMVLNYCGKNFNCSSDKIVSFFRGRSLMA